MAKSSSASSLVLPSEKATSVTPVKRGKQDETPGVSGVQQGKQEQPAPETVDLDDSLNITPPPSVMDGSYQDDEEEVTANLRNVIFKIMV